MYMPDETNYYIFKRIINSDEKKLTKNIIKDAVNIYGFKKVYNTGYITNFKILSKVEKSIIQKSNLLSDRTIKFIYEK